MNNIKNNDKANNRIPGPKYLPWIGWRLQGLSMLKDPMKHFMSMYEKYGYVSAWNTRNPKHIYAFGPAVYREIILNPDIYIVDAFREGNLPRGSAMEKLTFGLMRLNGDVHHKHRRLMQPAFRQDIVNSYRNEIIAATQEELDTWVTGEIRSIDHDLMRLITFISMRTMFGMEPDEEARKLQRLIKDLMKYAGSPASMLFRFNIPGTPYYNMLKTSIEIEALLKLLINRKRISANSSNDVLSILIRSVDDENGTLSDDELISEAYTIFCHESSAATLTWCMFLLDQHPFILNKLINEIVSISNHEPPTIEQLAKMPLLDNVVKESIRLLPPAGFSIRYTNTATQLAGLDIPKDAMIFTSSYVTHRIPELYNQPLKFDPFRWENIAPTPFEYMAFGAGTHSCIGKYFAIVEIKIILCMLLQRFRPSLVPDSIIDRGMRISFVPKYGLPMKIHACGAQPAKPGVRGNIHQSVDLK